MDSKKRRQRILNALRNRHEPITGKTLANVMEVSRQVIVSDIAILRAKGYKILATPQGYILSNPVTSQRTRATIACRHFGDEIQKELETVVKYGGKIIDVTVEHPIYGELTGVLMIKSLHDVDEFLKKLKQTKAKPLLSLTDGIHLHTIEADDTKTLEIIKKHLKKINILFEED